MFTGTDTGVLLRLFDRADPHHSAIRQALRVLQARGDKSATSPQNIAEFWNVCTRPAAARGGLGLSAHEAERRVRLLERLFRVLPDSPVAYPLWRKLVIQQGVKGVQVHDVRLVAWMQAHGITHLLTLNAADFARYPGITACKPQDLLSP